MSSNSSRFIGRVRLGLAAATRAYRRHRPLLPVKSILVAQRLLLGDTVMLAPLLAALRAMHPQATIDVTVPKAYLPLFSNKPYQARALAFDPACADSVQDLLSRVSRTGYDLAVVPGDNRYAFLARALGARWTVAFEGDRPAWKHWFVDEHVPLPRMPMALADIFALLAQAGDLGSKLSYRLGDWAAPAYTSFDFPAGDYAVLHLGAGSPLRLWSAEGWRTVAAKLVARGITPVWSGGPGEDELVRQVDPDRCYPSYAGQLNLAQLWHLLARATLIVCPDTGVAHMAKLTTVPTVCIFGQGSAPLHGRGDYFRDIPFWGVTKDDFPCRDQRQFFKRDVEWLRRCARTLKECPRARCIEAIEIGEVLEAIERALSPKK